MWYTAGVESVNVDMATNKITVTGKVDPARVKERIEKKMKKKVEILQVKSIDKKVVLNDIYIN